MADWAERRRLKLKKGSRWHAKPGNQVFVANAGAVRFEYPGKWIVEPGENGAICLYDRKPPTHHAILQVSVFELLPEDPVKRASRFNTPLFVDWTTLPLPELFVQSTQHAGGDPRRLLSEQPLQQLLRAGLEAVWRERLMFDEQDQKEVISRTFIGRGANVNALLSYDFYADEYATFQPVWENIVRSLVLGRYIKDPTTGF